MADLTQKYNGNIKRHSTWWNNPDEVADQYDTITFQNCNAIIIGCSTLGTGAEGVAYSSPYVLFLGESDLIASVTESTNGISGTIPKTALGVTDGNNYMDVLNRTYNTDYTTQYISTLYPNITHFVGFTLAGRSNTGSASPTYGWFEMINGLSFTSESGVPVFYGDNFAQTQIAVSSSNMYKMSGLRNLLFETEPHNTINWGEGVTVDWWTRSTTLTDIYMYLVYALKSHDESKKADFKVYIEDKTGDNGLAKVTFQWSSGLVNNDDTGTYNADNTVFNLLLYRNSGDISDELGARTIEEHEKARVMQYGDLELVTSYQAMLGKVDHNKLSELIGKILKPTSFNDVYALMYLEYEDGRRTSFAYTQIPYNHLSSDTSHLTKGVVDYGGGNDGTTIQVFYGKPSPVDDDVKGWNDDARLDEDSDDYTTPTSDSTKTGTEYSYNTALSMLTTSYALTESELQTLGQRLWSDSYFDNIELVNNNPLENIVAVKSFVYDFDGTAQQTMVVGNVELNVDCKKIPKTFIPRRNIGTFAIVPKYHSFLDYVATKITIFLPFIGFRELDTSVYMGKTLKLEYIYDIIVGSCVAYLFADNVLCDQFSGTMGVDIPITSSNRANVEFGAEMSGVNTILGTVGNLATGNILGAVSTAVGGLANALPQYHSQTSGSPSSSCDAYGEQDAFLIIDRPIYQEPTNYKHDYGKPCNLSMNLGDLWGYCEIDNIDLSDLGATEQELDDLLAILKGGFYI